MELAKEGRRISRPHRNLPEDIHGMNAAEGILTSRGGMTSAALVARGMGTLRGGMFALNINYGNGAWKSRRTSGRGFHFHRRDHRRGDRRTTASSSSEIIQVLIEEDPAPGFPDLPAVRQAHGLADDTADLGVRTNADTPRDATTAALRRTGIGLCRTEHMSSRRADCRRARNDPR